METSPHQVLYALVALGVHLVAAILLIGAVRLVPGWWTVTAGVLWLGVGLAAWGRWRRTGTVLALTVGFFLVWVAVTLAVR